MKNKITKTHSSVLQKVSALSYARASWVFIVRDRCLDSNLLRGFAVVPPTISTYIDLRRTNPRLLIIFHIMSIFHKEPSLEASP